MRHIRWPSVRSARLAAGLVAVTTLSVAVLSGSATAQSRAAGTPAVRAAATDPGDVATATKTSARANAVASVARAKVDSLLDRYQSASGRVDAGVRALSAAFAAGASADVDQDTAAAQQRRARATQSAQLRAVYAGGGGIGLTVSVFGASSPDDALWRASTADRVLTTLLAEGQDQIRSQTELADRARRRANEADAATQAQADALESLKRRETVAAQALDQAQQTLDRLDTQARHAEAAQESARQIARAKAAAAEAARTAMGTVTALGIPAEYEQAYRAAALTCPGMSWTLLAGVGQVETGHGRNNRPSSAGAIGPMQFMPSTFAAYAVDGDEDGTLDAWDPQDSIFSAAHYLCASGADGSTAGIHQALLAYNHAEWYVDLVLAAEQAIIAQKAANAAS